MQVIYQPAIYFIIMTVWKQYCHFGADRRHKTYDSEYLKAFKLKYKE